MPAAGASPVAFIGLGMMGLPMASRLVAAGFAVRGADLSASARAAFADAGGLAFDTARQAAEGTSVVITMLPNGSIVREALLGEDGAARRAAARRFGHRHELVGADGHAAPRR